MNILQVNTSDVGGGAENIAWKLHQAYLAEGHASSLVVGNKQSKDPCVFWLPNESYRSRWMHIWRRIEWRLPKRVRLFPATQSILDVLREPGRWLRRIVGYEDFDFPGSRHIATFSSQSPDILHCHNLHGEYFDLRSLADFSQRFPLVLTLHDAWLLSGHCAHSFECQRWKIGCGQCPDLKSYPAISRDRTAKNWRRKKRIYQKSRVYVATPSKWLMEKVKESMLAPAILESRIIPHGVDLSIFRPRAQEEIRHKLKIPLNRFVVLFIGYREGYHPFKDYVMLTQTIAQLQTCSSGKQMLFLALNAAREKYAAFPDEQIRVIPFQQDATRLAAYYQAADVYLHPANADTFPNMVIESLACGTPVIATSVGGIPEQIDHERTGMLVPLHDASAMTSAVQLCGEHPSFLASLRQQAAETAKEKFDHTQMITAYLSWYHDILRCHARN